VLDCYGFGDRFLSYFGARREQLLSTIASKVDAKISAKKVMKMNAKIYEKYVKINGGSMKIH